MNMLKRDISPKAKGLIFDLDGTLVDTMPFHFKAWQTSANEHGMNMSKEFLQSLMGAPAAKIAEQLCLLHGISTDMPVESLVNKKAENFMAQLNNAKPIDEVFDIVKEYHGKLPMAIGTGGNKKTVTQTLKHTGIGEYFEVVITANDVENHKPAPDTFLCCAELINVEPQFCEVFEDGDPGLKAAKAAGMIATDIREWIELSW